MLIAKRLWPRTALLQRTLVLVGVGLLAGCQSTADEAPPPTPAAVAAAAPWQVVERLGDARWRGEAGGAWTPAMPSGTLPAGSEVTTGRGGRLIAARAGTHISVGPDSRFSLPDGAPEAALEQDAGRLRYRVAEVAPQPLVVATRFLEIAPEVAVFDVTVTPAATEVVVERGSVRIATPDGMRQIELGAGQSAYAGAGAGQALTFRRAPGEPAEPVAPLAVPAINPRVAAAEGRAVTVPGAVTITSSQASTSGADASQAAALVVPADVAAAAARRERAAARRESDRVLVAVPALAPAIAQGEPSIAFGQGVVLRVGMVRRAPPDGALPPRPATADAPAGAAGPNPGEPAGSLPPEPAAPQPAAPATAAPAVETSGAPAVEAPGAPAVEASGEPAVEDRSLAFDRLTDGMLGGVAAPRDPAPPAAGASPL